MSQEQGRKKKKQNKTQSSEAFHTPSPAPFHVLRKLQQKITGGPLDYVDIGSKSTSSYSVSIKEHFSNLSKPATLKAIMSLPHFDLCSQNYSRRAGLNPSLGNQAGINIKKI